MSKILLDTVGSNKSYSYYIPVSRPEAPDKKSQTTETGKSSRNNYPQMLTAGLIGLAVLGSAGIGIKIYRNKKLQRQIFALNKQLNEEYSVVKEKMVEEFNKSELPDSFSKGKFHNKKITSSKDIREVKAFYDDTFNRMCIAQKEAASHIKNSIANLSDDTEWKELRKLRKQMLKDKDGKDMDKYELAIRKIPLINDLLVLKLHPEKEDIFRARTFATVGDVKRLLKKNIRTGKNFDDEYKKIFKFEVNYNSTDDFFISDRKLSIIDFFRDDYETYNLLKAKIKLVKVVLDEDIPFVQKQWTGQLSALAADFRKNDNLLNKKKLIASK